MKKQTFALKLELLSSLWPVHGETETYGHTMNLNFLFNQSREQAQSLQLPMAMIIL